MKKLYHLQINENIKKIILNKNSNGNNQFKKSEIKSSNKDKTCRTAIRLGKGHKAAGRTIVEYAKYANSIDVLNENEAELVSKVLNGDIKNSQENINKLSRDKSASKDKIWQHLEQQKKYRKVPAASKSVKDMPEYDPDAEISSMIYTIPSWTNSISRLISTDFSKVTNNAKLKLLNELDNLAFNIEVIKLSIGESNE